jgi:hypothetical protein
MAFIVFIAYLILSYSALFDIAVSITGLSEEEIKEICAAIICIVISAAVLYALLEVSNKRFEHLSNDIDLFWKLFIVALQAFLFVLDCCDPLFYTPVGKIKGIVGTIIRFLLWALLYISITRILPAHHVML